MSATVMRSGVIALTEDPAQLARLRNKEEEYRKRNTSRAPEAQPLETYKHRLLSTLLEKGALDVDAEEAAFARNPWHRPADFRQAVDIVVAYNAGDLSKLRGGTGLR